jgi:hypothetical protein
LKRRIAGLNSRRVITPDKIKLSALFICGGLCSGSLSPHRAISSAFPKQATNNGWRYR